MTSDVNNDVNTLTGQAGNVLAFPWNGGRGHFPVMGHQVMSVPGG